MPDGRPTPPRSQQRHSKSFTGCWTCRKRRVKCDEKQPTCQQCSKKGVACEGYSAKLQWLKPVTPRHGYAGHRLGLNGRTGSCGTPSLSSGGSAHAYSSRRHITAISSNQTVSLDEATLERALAVFNDIEDGQLKLRRPPTRNGPFSVFNGLPDTVPSPSSEGAPRSRAWASHVASPPSPTVYSDSVAWCPAFSDLAGSHNGFPAEHTAEAVEVFGGTSPNGSPKSKAIHIGDASFQVTSHAQEHEQSTTAGGSLVLCSEYRDVPNDVPGHAVDLTLYRPRQVFLSDQDCHLLQHYAQKAIKVFSVIDTDKTLWRTFHLPRALQSTGELATLGSSPAARSALLKALLSVSAYVLSNSHRSGRRLEEAQNWADKGLRLKHEAINLLRKALDPDVEDADSRRSKTRPKYKELLATILSMISIDVVSGDTESCSLHLAGCERLIRATRKTKLKYSVKARGLHRIFFYLRTIHESTKSQEDRLHTSASGRPSFLSEGDFYTTQATPEDQSSSPENMDWLDTTEDATSPTISCESMYGVPLSLLVLMSKTVAAVQMVHATSRRDDHDLARQTLHSESRTGGSDMLSHRLQCVCDQVESDILEFSVDDAISEATAKLSGETAAKVVELQTKAFHSALIIYFSQHVRNMHRLHLQPYVKSTLDSLEAVETLKQEADLNTGPIFWPAFIAASEAWDVTLRARFTEWFSQARKYGVEAAWKGYNVAVSVWNRGQTSDKPRATSMWRAIAEEQRACLMLT